jgi:parallel beta-helix repeat protein
MNTKFLSLFILIFFLFTTISTGITIVTDIQAENEKLGNHSPIRIISNNEFLPENGVTGGFGTNDDPYIIDNWIIVRDNSSLQGIFINGTDAYFIIRNCTISGFQDPLEFCQGIELSDVSNGRIEDTIVDECQTGITIRYSKDNVIFNCTCFNYPLTNGYGIAIFWSINISVLFSNCYNMYNGIDISESSDIILLKIACYNNANWGIFAGMPRNQNIMNFHIENCTFESNREGGIWFSGSNRYKSFSNMRNCSFYNNNVGIFLQHTSNNIIENCVFEHNYNGMCLDAADNNIIRNCSFNSHGSEAISIQGGVIFSCGNNEISYCDFIENKIGIFLIDTRGNNIHHNIIANNSYIGIVAAGSNDQIRSNNFFNNGCEYSEAPDSAGVYVWRSFLDVRYNWWGSSDGSSISLFIGINNWKIINIRIVNDADTILFRYGFACFRHWLSGPVPDAGRQV